MKKIKYAMIIGALFVLVTGSLSHFLYGWTGHNTVIGLFTPVNESIWEHMKLLFFPMLLYSLIIIFKFNGEYPCLISSLCFGILTGTLLIPALFYAYTTVWGKNVFLLDIGTFILSILAAFLLSYRFTLLCRLKHIPFCYAFRLEFSLFAFYVLPIIRQRLKSLRFPAAFHPYDTRQFPE